MKFANNIKARPVLTGAGLVLVIAISITSYAFVLNTSSWPTDEATFFVQWDAGGVFDTAFIEAINEWNGNSAFGFNIDTSRFVDPCLSVAISDRENGYRFSADDCGRGFGASTLAVAWTWSAGSTTIDTDIVFNSNFTWGVHDSTTNVPYDFRRIAVHELGHALGLGHETVNPAIMQPSYSLNIMVPQVDDVNGEVALYGPLPDADDDTVPDSLDNCSLLANPNQRDTDGDLFGNRCDADFNNDGTVTFADFVFFSEAYGSANVDADLNGTGIVVSFADFVIFSELYLLAPGPSGLVP